MSVRAFFLGPQYEYGRSQTDHDPIDSDRCRSGLSFGRYHDAVSDGQTNSGKVCLGYSIWSASGSLHNRGLRSKEIRPPPCIFVLPKNTHFAL